MANYPKSSPWVIRFEQTTSTMIDAKAIIDNIIPTPEEFVVIADSQSEGTGRNNNTWYSPQGGLWFTYCIKTSVIPTLETIVLGYCLLKAIIACFPHLENQLRIKWTNDLYYATSKLAGILTRKHNDYLLIGIGINTNVIEEPLQNQINLVSLSSILKYKISHSALITQIINRIKYEMPGYLHNPGLIIDKINAVLFLKGSLIVFDNGKEQVTGILNCLTTDGGIEIMLPSGNRKRYYAGSIIITS